jgi:hypothetical protein
LRDRILQETHMTYEFILTETRGDGDTKSLQMTLIHH